MTGITSKWKCQMEHAIINPKVLMKSYLKHTIKKIIKNNELETVYIN